MELLSYWIGGLEVWRVGGLVDWWVSWLWVAGGLKVSGLEGSWVRYWWADSF